MKNDCLDLPLYCKETWLAGMREACPGNYKHQCNFVTKKWPSKENSWKHHIYASKQDGYEELMYKLKAKWVW